MALPILDFLVERMTEYDSSYEHRKGTAFSELFMQPMALIVQPLRDEANVIQVNQSLKRILELEDPDLWFEDSVNELVANLFVYRRDGSKSGGIVRVYYLDARDVSFLAGSLEFTSDTGLRFINTANVSVTAQEMSIQIEDEFYYFEVPIEAEEEGEDYNVDAEGIITVNDINAAKASNPNKISGGANRESNTELITRTQKSIGVRDMNTGKGFNAIMFEKFLAKITELRPIGFGDPEMMRDIYFNYHIGGRIDGYVKTPTIQDGEFDILGINIDFTRRLSTLTNLIMIGTTNIEVGRQNLDNTENDVRIFNIEQAERAAAFFSYVNLSTPIDLSLNQFIRVGVDSADTVNIKISGAHPGTTQSGEIINRINVGVGKSIASLAVNPIIVGRRSTGNIPDNGSIHFIDTTANIFDNVGTGDLIYIMVGNNKAIYEIDAVVSSNELVVIGTLPFVEAEEEVNYRISRTGSYIRLLSPSKGTSSKIIIGSPTAGSDALLDAIGLTPGTHIFWGKGTYEYTEGLDFNVNLTDGKISRIIGPTILPNTLTGQVNKHIFFEDFTPDIFLNVQENDILTVYDSVTPEYERDYRILEKINNNRIRVDYFFATTETDIKYRITRSGIKDQETVQVTFDYNPMSIDIGDRIQLDEHGRERGVRPGREDQTITDLAFLYIDQIELINPVTGETLGEILDGKGGYGRGGYGRGGYGVGSQAQYFLKVNRPELRFSALEDSFIAIDTAYLGQSIKVTYKYVPEVIEFQDFADSDSERVLDAHILIKHFLPAVVDINVQYTTSPTIANTPSIEEVEQALRSFINTAKAGSQIDASDIVSVIYDQIDLDSARNVKVKTPIDMMATIHNTNGSQTILKSTDMLKVSEEDILPYTDAPLSPRITHWIAGNINLTAIELQNSGVI